MVKKIRRISYSFRILRRVEKWSDFIKSTCAYDGYELCKYVVNRAQVYYWILLFFNFKLSILGFEKILD